MSKFIASVCMMIALLNDACICKGSDGDAREAYQIQLNKFLMEVDGKVSNITEKLDVIIRLNLSPCLLEDWLKQFKGQMARGTATFDDLFLDKVDEHLRVVTATESELTEFIKSKTGVLNELDRLKVRELSIVLAANEMTSRTIKNQVLPQVYRRIDDLALSQRNSEELIKSIKDAYRSDFDSLCARLKLLEERVNRGDQEQRLSGNSPFPQRLDYMTRENSGAMQPWQPDAYVTSISHLCPNAKLVATSYTYYARVHRASGVVLEEKFGDIYSNCQGKVVLLLKYTR